MCKGELNVTSNGENQSKANAFLVVAYSVR